MSLTTLPGYPHSWADSYDGTRINSHKIHNVPHPKQNFLCRTELLYEYFWSFMTNFSFLIHTGERPYECPIVAIHWCFFLTGHTLPRYPCDILRIFSAVRTLITELWGALTLQTQGSCVILSAQVGHKGSFNRNL